MSERDDHIALLAAHLVSACPTRVVTRSLEDIGQRKDADLVAGIIAIVAAGEGGYPNLVGRLGMDGRLRLMIIGQLKVAENTANLAIEQAEMALFEQIITALRAGTGFLKCIDLNDFRQSAQLEHPYGWIAIELEWAS